MRLFQKRRGFSLVEMLVAMAIMILIIVGALMSNSRFSNDLELTNLAYDIAFTIREAQAYGLSVKEWKNTSGINNNDFNAGYGIRFAKYKDSATQSLGNQEFVLFNDVIQTGNDAYNKCQCGSGANSYNDLNGCKISSNEYIKSYLLSGKNKIKSFSMYDAAGSYMSGFDFSVNSGESDPIDIIFFRPDQAPFIVSEFGDFCSYYGGLKQHNVAKFVLTITNDKGTERQIVVDSIGQIQVKQVE